LKVVINLGGDLDKIPTSLLQVSPQADEKCARYPERKKVGQ